MKTEIETTAEHAASSAYSAAEQPRWSDAERTRIDLLVTFPGVGTVPFTAAAQDDTEYGPELYARAIAGDFGEIAAYAPPTFTEEQLIEMAVARRNAQLADAAIQIAPLQDAVDLDEATAQEQALLRLWKAYRVALSRIEQQPGYPQDIQWPDAPDLQGAEAQD